jgi:hypothetical protein
MILQKEWLDRAEKYAEETTPTTGNQTLYSTAINAARYDYIQGATEMLMAVEVLVYSEIDYYQSQAAIFALKDILKQLQSIKPLTDV